LRGDEALDRGTMASIYTTVDHIDACHHDVIVNARLAQ